jgi:hypothetical protein
MFLAEENLANGRDGKQGLAEQTQSPPATYSRPREIDGKPTPLSDDGVRGRAPVPT